jgi:polysaccharide export outer membrane protein
MRKFLIRVAVLLVLSMILPACGGQKVQTRYVALKSSNKSGQTVKSRNKTARLNDSLMLSATSQHHKIEESYKLGPDDIIQIEAYNVEELNKTVRVNTKGEIALPLVGSIRVGGLTVPEVERFIEKKLEQFVNETVVTIHVKEYKSQNITVIGAVSKPQVYSVTGQRYLLDMLMMAGGISEKAGNVCYILRPVKKDDPTGRVETIIVELDELLIEGNFALNLPIFAGDVIRVAKGGVIFIDGAVRAPGAYPLQGKTTLVQAMIKARGTHPDADTDSIRIFRKNQIDEKKVIVANYEDMRDGKEPDILLKENDIIVVPMTGLAVFFRKFFGTIGRFSSFGVSGNYTVF